MAAAIQRVHGIEPQMIPGAGGVFDVHANGELIFSKHEVGRFPDNDEILSKLATLER